MNRSASPLDLSGLEMFRSSSLLEAQVDALVEAQQISLELIDFDPLQPRRKMDEQALSELAESIRVHGVLEPVSLRLHPGESGRYIINRGERRVRACRIAGKSTVPAFLDARVDPFVQAVENLHREDMSPFDLCAFIVEREKEGLSRAEIGRRLVKSKSYITQVASLQSAPEEIRRAFEEGRVRDVRALYELTHRAAEQPDTLRALIADRSSITRADVQAAFAGLQPPRSTPSLSGQTPRPSTRAPSLDGSGVTGLLRVQVGDRQGRLDPTWTSEPSRGLVVFDDSVESFPLKDMQLVQWDCSGLRQSDSKTN